MSKVSHYNINEMLKYFISNIEVIFINFYKFSDIEVIKHNNFLW